MPADLSLLYERLHAVDSTLVLPYRMDAAEADGARLLSQNPHMLPAAALELARENPVLSVAQGLGALKAAWSCQEPSLVAQAVAGLGIALCWWGYYRDARDCLDEALPELDTQQSLLVAEWHAVLCERRLMGLRGTDSRLMSIADRLDASGDAINAQRCRLNAVYSLLADTRRTEAQVVLRDAKQFFASHDLPADRAIALSIEARDLLYRGELEAGLGLLDQAEETFSQRDMTAMLCFAWMVRSVYYSQRHQVDQALHWSWAAHNRAKALRHEYYQLLSLTDIAAIQFQQGNLDRHLQTWVHISLLAIRLDLKATLAHSELTIANHRLQQGDYQAAAAGYRRAAELYNQVGDPIFSATCTLNLGVVARREGNFSESLRLINEARTVFERERYLELLATAHNNLGKTYATFGYLEPAIEHLESAIRIADQLGPGALAAQPVTLLAQLLAQRGQPDRAHALLDRAAEQAQAAGVDFDVALCRRTRADVFMSQGNPSTALELYQASLSEFKALSQREAAWEAQLGIAEAYTDLGRSDEASRELDHLEVGSLPPILRWRHCALSGKVAHAQHRPQEALQSYLDALSQVRAARRTLHREEEAGQLARTWQPTYDSALDIASELGDSARAFIIAELQGAQLLSARLGYLPPEGHDLETLAARLTEQLNRCLGRAWTVLRYAWHRRSLLLFTLTPTGLDWHHIPLEGRTQPALRLCTNPDDTFRRFAYLGRSSVQSNALPLSLASRRDLFGLLIPAAVRARLHPDHTLIIVPSHQLHGLAFQALLDDEAPLIERSRLLYTPSLSLLASLMERSAPPPPVEGQGLLVAQTHFDMPGYSDLPHITQEVEAVVQQSNRIRMLLSAEIDCNKLAEDGAQGRLFGYDWLHLATHAYVDPATGAFTGLLIGSGILTIGDIAQWRLAARLVTLSACQSGMGRWHYGDEISGLAQAFLSTGAQAVVASLWLAADAQTADLMAEFYAALNQGESPLAALAQAQRTAARSGLEAYYWAPFSLFGRP